MDDLTASDQLVPASDYAGFVRRHRLRLAAGVLIGVVGGLALSLTNPDTYSATASVALTPVPVYVMPSVSELAPPPVSIDTDAQLLRSAPVQEVVARALGVPAWRSEEHMRVTASPNTSILHVTVSGPNAVKAATAAEAAAHALVDVRRSTLGAITNEQIRQLRFQIVATEGSLAREQARRMIVPAREELFAELLELRTRLAELEAARLVPAEMVGPAPARGRADYANTEVPVTSGAALGLVIGCLVGTARDRHRGESPDLEENDHAD